MEETAQSFLFLEDVFNRLLLRHTPLSLSPHSFAPEEVDSLCHDLRCNIANSKCIKTH